MNMKRYVVTLTKEEHDFLAELTYKGRHRSQKVLNALVLLACDKGKYQKLRSTNAEISKVLNTSMRKIDRVKKRFVTKGLDVALNGKKSVKVYGKKADGNFEAHLIALSCS